MKTKLSLLALLVSLVANAAGTVRYVHPSGNDSWTGLTTNLSGPNGPKATIGAGVAATLSADILSVMEGTYVERVTSGWVNGTSLSNPTIYSNYANHVVMLRPGSGSSPVLQAESPSESLPIQYVQWVGWKIDGTGLNQGVPNIKMGQAFYNNVVSNVNSRFSPGSHGFTLAGRTPTTGHGSPRDNTFYGLTIDTNAQFFTSGNAPHPCYVSGICSNNVFDSWIIHEFRSIGSLATYGFHLYSGQEAGGLSNTIRNCLVYNNSTNLPAGEIWRTGIGIFNHGNRIYNNIITNCHKGIYIAFGAESNIVAHNTIAYNGWPNTDGLAGLLMDSVGTLSNLVINNLIVSNYGGGIKIGGGTGQNYLTRNIVSRNNSTYNYMNPDNVQILDNNLIHATQYDPAFVSATDLRITSGSAARNAGSTLSYIAVDKEGTGRPQEASSDVGMDEYGSGGVLPTWSIEALGPYAFEQGLQAQAFRMTRVPTTGQITNTIAVDLGTATMGTHFVTQPLTNVLSNGVGTWDFTVTPINVSGTTYRTVGARIVPDAANSLGSPTNAVITIVPDVITRDVQRSKL